MSTESALIPELDVGDLYAKSPAEVLAALTALEPTDPRWRDYLFRAEELSFSPDQAAALRALLRPVIAAAAEPLDRDDEVAVASAIRRYVASLPVAGLAECRDWLTVERRMPPVLELEAVKMIARKLAATLPPDAASLAPLAEQLIDLARAYLAPRILARRTFAATVVECALALALLGSPHAAELADRLRAVDSAALRLVVARRAAALADEVAARFPGERSAPARQALAGLAAVAVAA